MRPLYVFLLLSLRLLVVENLGLNWVKRVKNYRLAGPCPGKRNLPWSQTVLGARLEGSKVLFNYTTTVRELTSAHLKMSLTIQRCKALEQLDTCETIHNYKNNKYCDLIRSKSGMWASFFQNIEPEFKCPIKKGNYSGRNGVTDLGAFLLVPGGNWFWKIRMEVADIDQNKLLLCLVTEAQLSAN